MLPRIWLSSTLTGSICEAPLPTEGSETLAVLLAVFQYSSSDTTVQGSGIVPLCSNNEGIQDVAPLGLRWLRSHLMNPSCNHTGVEYTCASLMPKIFDVFSMFQKHCWFLPPPALSGAGAHSQALVADTIVLVLRELGEVILVCGCLFVLLKVDTYLGLITDNFSVWHPTGLALAHRLVWGRILAPRSRQGSSSPHHGPKTQEGTR